MPTLDEDTSDVVIASGAWGKVVAVRTIDGEVPTLNFLDDVDVQSQAQFTVRAERLAAVGKITNPKQFKILGSKGKPPVAEIKMTPGPGHRVYAIQEGRTWFVTHGGTKPKSNRLYDPEIDRARMIFKQRKVDES